MKKRSRWRTALFTPRGLVSLICAAACSLAGATLLAFFQPEAPTKGSHRTLTFEERVKYQRAIEEVYWQHRIWPNERRDSKPSLDAVLSRAQIERKVKEYLRNCQILRDNEHQITPQQLQAEMKRMAQRTKNPEMLRELFEALGNDPFVIAECLARPALLQRSVNGIDKMNPTLGNEPKQREQASLQSQSVEGESENTSDQRAFSGYSLPTLTDTATTCDDAWSSLIDLPARRANHTAVWTGSEMIVWGGINYDQPLGTGDRYNPATDSWSKVSLTNAPTARYNHTAVWTGKEMIVWGGETDEFIFRSGGKYNPANDSWTPTSITNAPTARTLQTAVWTGSEMIVWGGFDPTGLPSTGSRYNPITDSWQAITTTNAPGGRYQHSVVWTGTAMIIWGGRNAPSSYLDNGAKYNPTSDTWTGTSAVNAPGARFGQSAVWTGSEMIIWGGWNGTALSDGAKYNPAANAWIALSAINPPQARYLHSAVWTGSQMLVWGGNGYPDGQVNSGSRYNPATNIWSPMSIINAPSVRDTHTTIWTGSEMIVFGGGYGETLNTGGRYDPKANTWTPLHTTNTPEGRAEHTAVWTGSEMIVWGGVLSSTFATNTGGRYDPALDTWTPTSRVNAPKGREDHTAVWTGTEMIIWGGWYNDGATNHIVKTGGRYNPATDNWTPTTLTNAPDARRWHTAVWTGSEMIVWGGESGVSGGPINTGGRYNPSVDSWIATSNTNAPSPKIDHTAIWTGREMIVWGGGPYSPTNTGGRYNPGSDTWTATDTAGTPPRSAHSATWTGEEMIVWGGYSGGMHVNTGARYNPSTNTWTATSLLNAPDGRAAHVVTWTGDEMIVWGGYSLEQDRFFNTGGRYNPTTDSWTATTTFNAPHEAEFPTAVWTGNRMIVWGGFFLFTDPFGAFHSHVLGTGGQYCAEADPTPTLGNISTRLRVGTGNNVLIAGFIIGGAEPKKVIIRALGPTLGQPPFNVPDTLANPTLELHDANATIATNNDWQTTQLGGILSTSQSGEIASSNYAPPNGTESAIIATLAPGNYTAIVRGVNNTTGVALAEVYDLSTSGNSRLKNISTRGFVGTGDNVMIGGVIVVTQPTTVLLRALGPTLAQAPFNVAGAMANPQLELYDATSTIARNDDWRTTQTGGLILADQAAQIEATGYAPPNVSESAILVTLQPGNYTAIVRGASNTTGVALVEVYRLQ